jgi:DHA1 family inner membrane transport protein
MSLNLPLTALAAGAFAIGTTEFAPMGLLPVIAADLHVSIPTAGLLVTGYALGVVVGAPLLTLPTERVPRKWLLLGLMALFTLGNLLSALSPSYTVLLAARVVTCPSSDNLRQGAGFRSGGSGSSGFEVRRPSRGAASGDWRSSVV